MTSEFHGIVSSTFTVQEKVNVNDTLVNIHQISYTFNHTARVVEVIAAVSVSCSIRYSPVVLDSISSHHV